MRSPYKRAFAILADGLCALAAPLLLRGRRTPRVLPRAPRVLLIRCDHIGDAAMAATVLEAVRQQLGASQLDVLVAPWTQELFLGHPSVTNVLSYPTPWWLAARSASLGTRLRAWFALPALIRRIRRGRYDIGIDLRGDLRHIFFFLTLGGCLERVSTDRTGGRSLLTRFWPFDATAHELKKNGRVLAALDVNVDATGNSCPIRPLSLELEHDLESASGVNGLVAIATQGNQPSRAWPLAHAVELAKRLSDDLGVGVIYVGGPRERAVGDAIRAELGASAVNLAGRTTLSETLTVLGRTKALVTVDSGPMHLAGLTGTPVLALFGAGDPVQFGPWSPIHAVVRPVETCACPLAPSCSLTADGRGVCMNSITPVSVTAALTDLLPQSFPAQQCTPA